MNNNPVAARTARWSWLAMLAVLVAAFAIEANAQQSTGNEPAATDQSQTTTEAPPPAAPSDVVEEPPPFEEPDDPATAGDVAMNHTEIQALQETLRTLGYFAGPADGRKGPRTREALRNFQRDQALPVSGSLDAVTIERIDQQSKLAGAPSPAEAAPAPAAETASAPPASKGSSGSSPLKAVGGVFKATGKGLATAGTKTYEAGRTAGEATVTAGRAVGDAGATTGKAVGTAGKVTGTSVGIAGKAVATGTVAAYNSTRRVFVGDKKQPDDEIARSIQRQFAMDDRIAPDEIDIKVVKGNVTLTLPDGARSDLATATRLAKLTTGVKSVTPVYVSVDTYVPPQTQQSEPLPAPIVEPPPSPAEPSVDESSDSSSSTVQP